MNMKTFATASTVIFALVAVLHLIRIIAQWSVVIDGWSVPMWISFVGLVVAGLLTAAGYRVLQQIHRVLS